MVEKNTSAAFRGKTDDELKVKAVEDWDRFPAVRRAHDSMRDYYEVLKDLRDRADSKG